MHDALVTPGRLDTAADAWHCNACRADPAATFSGSWRLVVCYCSESVATRKARRRAHAIRRHCFFSSTSYFRLLRPTKKIDRWPFDLSASMRNDELFEMTIRCDRASYDDRYQTRDSFRERI